jgi:hypothetical protein
MPFRPERVEVALRMFREGWPYRTIGAEIGITGSGAFYLVKRWGQYEMEETADA